MSFNLYSVFVGPPTTGKIQAIKKCAVSPMFAVFGETDLPNIVTQKCTSSGLIKTVADNNKGYLLPEEIYVLFKLLKPDEENATGEGPSSLPGTTGLPHDVCVCNRGYFIVNVLDLPFSSLIWIHS